ncbi:MAG: ATP-dependent Clp protease proteolytic subunit [Proteobacteria bacterium]|nr:ATP-dependent Clp protease proteolytic subunit [Pseudomonadota bacterium]
MSEVNSLLRDLEKHHLWSKLFDSRTLFLSGGVNSHIAEKITQSLYVMNNTCHDPIKLIINSPGGEVSSGLSIYDTIRFIDSDVWVLNSGLCASIATIINCAVDKKNRFSLPHTKFLIHQPLIMGYIQGQASDIEIYAEDILQSRDLLNSILADACGQSKKKIEQDTLRDYWMNAQEAKDYGLVSQIIQSEGEFKLN